MSEVKLNLLDSRETLHGKVHGSIADAAVAALSAEPETIAELEAALARYLKPSDEISSFASLCSTNAGLSAESDIRFPRLSLDLEPWDAGLVVIDLAARIVAAESTYSMPHHSGEVHYHDGTRSTDVAVPYRVPDDWLFVYSVVEYEGLRDRLRVARAANPPLDARAILYGRALSETIVSECLASNYKIESAPKSSNRTPQRHCVGVANGQPGWNGGCEGVDALGDTSSSVVTSGGSSLVTELEDEANGPAVCAIHARWLTTPREDLRGQSPRDVMLAKNDFVDFDLHTRELQWSFCGEGPPCLSGNSSAFKFAGFGTHEYVVYYDLVRHLVWSALDDVQKASICSHGANESRQIETAIARLEEIKTNWLEQPQRDYEGRIPAILIENERRRLPLAMGAHEMIIDEDCDLCRMSAEDVAMGYGPGFWHLDGSHMDDDFAFSFFKTREEWETENRRRDEFSKEFERRWEERQQRIARGEPVEDDFDMDWVDPLDTGLSDFGMHDGEDESSDLVQ